MKQLLLVEQEELDKLNQKVDRLMALVLLNQQNGNTQKTDWVPLQEFFKKYNIKKNSWYRHYKDKIKYRDDGTYIWVYTPSMEKYLMDLAIN